jgi:hypothetical protein
MLLRAQFESHLLELLRHRPTVHLSSARRLEELCRQQLDLETLPAWRTFWSLTSHFFAGLCAAPHRSFDVAEASATTQVLGGLQLREQFKESEAPVGDNLQVINHLLFLEQADVLSQRLVNLLNDWSDTPEAELPSAVQSDAHYMAKLAQDVELTAIQQVADALSAQLARIRAKRVADDIKASLSGAQEVSRLLQHFAVGSMREAQPQVLAALKGE